MPRGLTCVLLQLLSPGIKKTNPTKECKTMSWSFFTYSYPSRWGKAVVKVNTAYQWRPSGSWKPDLFLPTNSCWRPVKDQINKEQTCTQQECDFFNSRLSDRAFLWSLVAVGSDSLTSDLVGWILIHKKQFSVIQSLRLLTTLHHCWIAWFTPQFTLEVRFKE